MAENRSRYAILGALTLKPMSGYDVRAFFAQGVSHFWRESYGQIYPILRQLAADGLVAPLAADQPGADNGRRTVFAITPAGRQHLASWLAQPADHQVGRIEVLLKLFFAREAAPGAVAEVLQGFRADHAERLAHYEATGRQLRAQYGSMPELPLWLAGLSYGEHVSRAMLAWCDEAERALTAVAPRGADAPPPG
jgi:DNA-binding PadR family transcriptional regulator